MEIHTFYLTLVLSCLCTGLRGLRFGTITMHCKCNCLKLKHHIISKCIFELRLNVSLSHGKSQMPENNFVSAKGGIKPAL